jgi:Trk K+ transport system NAD-binding subunit
MRVLVAGAGVWGSYIADHLVSAGHEVLVVEQDATTAARARASGGRTVVAGAASSAAPTPPPADPAACGTLPPRNGM